MYLPPRSSVAALLAAAFFALIGASLQAAELTLVYALGREVYQTDESVPLAAMRSGGALEAGELALELAGTDGTAVSFVFKVPGAPAARSEFLNLDARMLRPGDYTVTVTADGATATLPLKVVSHVRKSSYRIVNWGSPAKGEQNRTQGENSLGYNLVMQNMSRDGLANTVAQIEGGVDWTSCCVMSGGHQMDLRMECDWSDPYVTAQGGTRRVMKDVFANRMSGNAIGSHFYDEPGLTWWKDPATGDTVPHMVPAQVRAYVAAFGELPLDYKDVDPKNPDHLRRWNQWATWKLSFMSAAWEDAAWAVEQVRPDYISFTQSQYGFSAFTDGYYFNVVDSLPLVSGHGGYHDWGPGYWHPSWTLDMARARDQAKPCWYMPLWYHNTTSDETRLEQYLSFATGIQGMMTPPPMDPAAAPFARESFDGIVESNHAMQRLGTIFTTMTETHAPVALLYSYSNMIHEQSTVNMKIYYAHETDHGRNLATAYIAGKLHQRTFEPIVDEDVVDGTLAMRHKALLLVSVKHLAPEVLEGLAAFIKDGGTVMITDDSKVKLAGAITVPAAFGPTAEETKKLEAAEAQIAALNAKMGPMNARLKEIGQALKDKSLTEEAKATLTAEQKAQSTAKAAIMAELAPFQAAKSDVAGMRGILRVAERFATGLEAVLTKAGIAPEALSTERGIGVQTQGAGDVTYLFAINATHDYDANGPRDAQLAMKSAETLLQIPATGTAIYDAMVTSAALGTQPEGGFWKMNLRFGPGQMRVYAQTRRPIGAVHVATPVIHRDLTIQNRPISVDLTATVSADDGSILSGSIPLQIDVVDALGATRYSLYRATSQGVLQLTLPLAANDPAGVWTVRVKELLGGTEGASTFTYAPAPRAGSLAGETQRSWFLEADRDLIFGFFRTHQDVTIVTGSNDAYKAVAERIAGYLVPWSVRTTIVDAESVNKGKAVSEEMAPSFAGLHYTPRGSIKPGEGNPATQVGFAVEGPVLLIGTPDDNPLIKMLAAESFLPVAPSAKTVLGVGRGLIAFQRDAIGARQESVTLIAYDQAGLDEAAGNLYELLAGLKPLTRWTLAASQSLSPATTAKIVPPFQTTMTVRLTDKADAMEIAGNQITAWLHDGSRATFGADGRPSVEVVGAAAVAEKAAAIVADPRKMDKAVAARVALPTRITRATAADGDRLAVIYVGGLVRVLGADDQPLAEYQFGADPLHLGWLGGELVVAFSDGQVRKLALPKP